MTSQDIPPTPGSTIAAVAAAFVGNATSTLTPLGPLADQVDSRPSEPIFLQTKLAQGVAGFFVWAALFLTCSQVRASTFNYFLVCCKLQDMS